MQVVQGYGDRSPPAANPVMLHELLPCSGTSKGFVRM